MQPLTVVGGPSVGLDCHTSYIRSLLEDSSPGAFSAGRWFQRLRGDILICPGAICEPVLRRNIKY